jgi:hypothetical protein
MHLDEERLQRLLHGELDRGAAHSAREHVATCAGCRAQVEAAEREEAELTRLLGYLDHPVPRLEPGDIAARAGPGRSEWVRRAAVVVLGLGLAGVAYAAPGSPIAGLIKAITGRSEIETRPADRPAPRQTGEPVVSGIAVDPGPRLVIVFPSPPAGARAQVSLGDTTDVVVRALTGRASFSSGLDRLVVQTTDSAAAFQIVVPRTAPWVEIRAGQTRIFSKQGHRITAATAPVAEGSYLIELGPKPQ